MKNYIPTIGVIASLAFASANVLAQNPTTPKSKPITPVPTTAPVAVAVPAQPEGEAEVAVEAALADQQEALENVNKSLTLIGAHSGRATSTRSLVIPKDPPDPKNLTDTEEDMSVMARILEKAVNIKRPKSERSATAGVWSLGTPSSAPKNLYIEGFGALFFLNVSFPLLPPATKEQSSESKSETDGEWEKTRNELYHPQSSSSDLSFNFSPFDSGSYVYTTGPAEEYDEDKVTQLKENLTGALKNASHIRRLKGDDTVTVIVTGRNPAPIAKVTSRRSQNGSSSSSSSSSSSWSTSRSGSQAPAARLIIRAKRSDIESFQKDKLSPDDFRKKVTMFVY
jgi:hypothetical protein